MSNGKVHDMNTVKVSRVALKETLHKNREQHRDQFEKAWAAYRTAMIATLEKNLDSVKNGNGKIEVNINLLRPQDHTEDYDRALQMLEWELEDSVELTITDFTQLVQDDWGWKQQFTTTAASYGVL